MNQIELYLLLMLSCGLIRYQVVSERKRFLLWIPSVMYLAIHELFFIELNLDMEVNYIYWYENNKKQNKLNVGWSSKGHFTIFGQIQWKDDSRVRRVHLAQDNQIQNCCWWHLGIHICNLLLHWLNHSSHRRKRNRSQQNNNSSSQKHQWELI
jgi:hypothetical protein